MAPRTIKLDRDGMRTFAPRTEEADGAIVGAADASETALDILRAGADGFVLPGRDVLDAARRHHDNVRTVAGEFDLVVERFERSQQRAPLPVLYARSALPDHMGPVGELNNRANRRWLDRELHGARQAARTAHAQRVAGGLRRHLGLATPPRVRVGSHRSLWSAGAAGTVGAESGVMWVVDEYSDGSAEVTLRYLHATSAQVGVGGELGLDGADLPLAGGPLAFGGSALVSASLAASVTRSWTRSFPSRSAAEAFVDRHRLDAVADQAAARVPVLGGWLAGRIDPGGMQQAAVSERARGTVASAGVTLGAHPFDDGDVGSELVGEASGEIAFSQRTDDRTGLRTEVAVLQGSLAASATVFGASWSSGGARSHAVAVTRSRDGRPAALTVTTTWDGDPGQRPPGVPAAGRARPVRSVAGDQPHHYELEIALDLTDPRNSTLARLAGDSQRPGGRLDAFRIGDLVEAVDDDAVRARGQVTLLEEATTGRDAFEVAVEGAKVMSLAVSAAAVSQERRTVAAWAGPGDRLRQVIGTGP